MSYTLIGTKDRSRQFHCNHVTWCGIIGDAQAHGWQPQGTLPPVPADSPDLWDRLDYYTPLGQIVTAEDATHLGDIIRCTYSDALDDYMLEFIRFCHGGSFRIF